MTVVIERSHDRAILSPMVWLYDLGSSVLGAVVAQPLIALLVITAIAVTLATIARRRGWLGRARRHPRATVAILVPLFAIVLPIGWYLTSPLVLSASIDEPPPAVAAARPSLDSSAAPATLPSVSPSSRPSTAPGATPAPPPPPPITRSGTFQGSDAFHFGRGTARLIDVLAGGDVSGTQLFGHMSLMLFAVGTVYKVASRGDNSTRAHSTTAKGKS